MEDKISAIVTDAHLRYSRVVVQSLGTKGISITASGEKDRPNKTFYSKYCKNRIIYPAPDENEELFVKTMMRAAKGHEVLIPMHERTIIPISKHLKEFERILKVPIPEYKILKIALDKAETVKAAQRIGIPTPQTHFPNNLHELESLSKNLNYPVVVKIRREIFTPPPRYTYAYSQKDLIYKYRLMHEKCAYPLIQELIHGVGYGFFTLFNKHHKPISIFCHRRIREYPITGGPSTYCESTYNQKIVQYGLKLLKEIKWYGVAMVEFRLDHSDNKFKLMEINPRFWGSLPLAIASGVDFPYLLYQMATGDDTKPQITYKIGVRCRFLDSDFLALIEALRLSDHEITYLWNFIKSFNDKNVVYGDFSMKDFGPNAYMFAHALMSIARKFKTC